jgi:hypothetical protein
MFCVQLKETTRAPSWLDCRDDVQIRTNAAYVSTLELAAEQPFPCQAA